MSTSEPADRYHHGDLRRALVEAALQLLAEGGTEALGLRELARRVGVSASAPYRHFRDKQALIQAVAAAGFEMFLEAVEGAKAGVAPEEQLGAMAEAYVHFALRYPRLYRLMFSSALGKFEGAGHPPVIVGGGAHGQNLQEALGGRPRGLVVTSRMTSENSSTSSKAR